MALLSVSSFSLYSAWDWFVCLHGSYNWSSDTNISLLYFYLPLLLSVVEVLLLLLLLVVVVCFVYLFVFWLCLFICTCSCPEVSLHFVVDLSFIPTVLSLCINLLLLKCCILSCLFSRGPKVTRTQKSRSSLLPQ